jgi:hypothetical protein
MYVEVTNNEKPKKFAIHELTAEDLELLQGGLINYEQNGLPKSNEFSTQRESCVDMYKKIDQELLYSR